MFALINTAWPLVVMALVMVVFGSILYRCFWSGRTEEHRFYDEGEETTESHRPASLPFNNMFDESQGASFERYLALLFARMGYQVRRPGYGGPNRFLKASRNNVTYIIQVQRSDDKIGINSIKEALLSRDFYGCEQVIVITNQYFTRRAVRMASVNKIVLVDRNDLYNEIANLNAKKNLCRAEACQ
ncbi:restriction endonuclease [Syntrophomonas erecta]